jgi:GNAT superfamily N-acetyltransferase
VDYTIRDGTEADLSDLVRMGTRFFPAVGYDRFFPASEDRMLALGRILLASGLLLVGVDAQDRPQGMIGALLFEHPMAEATCGSELFWWIEPAARGSLGIRLLKRAEQWAKAQGATHMMMVAPNADVAKIYERLHYQPAETSYLRRL